MLWWRHRCSAFRASQHRGRLLQMKRVAAAAAWQDMISIAAFQRRMREFARKVRARHQRSRPGAKRAKKARVERLFRKAKLASKVLTSMKWAVNSGDPETEGSERHALSRHVQGPSSLSLQGEATRPVTPVEGVAASDCIGCDLERGAIEGPGRLIPPAGGRGSSGT